MDDLSKRITQFKCPEGGWWMGRPLPLNVVQIEARKHVVEAITTLAKIIKGEASPKRLPAIREMLDLAYRRGRE